MNFRELMKYSKMVEDMYQNKGEVVTNCGYKLYREGDAVVCKIPHTVAKVRNNMEFLIKLLSMWEEAGLEPNVVLSEQTNKLSKLVNGMKSKCEKFTLNIDKGYVGVATQFADGTCRMVYTEPVDNEENIIKDLEDLFNFNITEKYIDSWIENWCSMDFKDKYNDKTTEELCNLLGVFGHRSSSYF